MHFKPSLFLAIATVQPILAVPNLNLAQIKNFYVTGASIDWFGGPFPYSNTANGPNHIEYISTGRNWNIRQQAFPGAVTDPTIVDPLALAGLPAPVVNWDAQISQVKALFNSDKANAVSPASGSNSLFVITASNTGNDMLNSWNKTQGAIGTARTNTINALINKIAGGFTDVYNLGGRNFIFFAPLPAQIIPAIQVEGAAAVSSVQQYAQQYNTALKARASSLQSQYPSANIYYLDDTQMFYDIRAGTLKTGPTAGYLVRDNFCPNVASNLIGATAPRNPNYNSCPNGYRARQFLFWDRIHFSSPLHCEYAVRSLTTLTGTRPAYPSNCQYADRTD